jgi:broad specificity phosphatase PhoE
LPDLPSLSRLYLIRHALPAGDSPRRYLGRADPGLGAAGRKQARGMARAHPGAVGLPVWTSPLRRARETAYLAFPGADLHVEPLAAELSFGVLDGLLPEEAARLYPEAYAHLRRNPLDAAPCGGESWADLLDRAAALASALAAGLTQDPRGVVLVAHRYLLAALVQTLARPATVPGGGLDYAKCLVLEAGEPQLVAAGRESAIASNEVRSWRVLAPEELADPGTPAP